MSTEIVNKLMATPFAFPHSVELSDGSSFHSPGMTLRDYFAAKVAQGDAGAADGWSSGVSEITLEERVKLYYRIADAMLKAREA
jgi:hypothetical protein